MSSKVLVNCEQCGKEKSLFPSQLKLRKYGVFCDKVCLGKFRSETLVGDWAANYKSGFSKSRDYLRVEARWHPNCDKQGYVVLHRLIAEAKLGRFLTEEEVVHHKDDNPTNNYWDNLEVMKQSEHANLHIENGTIERDKLTGQFIKGDLK